MRGWLNLRDLREPDWLSTITTTTTIAGITTTIIIITTIITIITRAYQEKGTFRRTSLFPAGLVAS
jgi:hypothetical protein